MLIKLLLLFTLVPLLELWILIKLGGLIGMLPTILIVASTGFAGVLLAKSQGLNVLNRMQQDIKQGILPGNKLIDGVFILVGGAFLITPGLLTDLFGFSLLVPLTRGWLKSAARHYIQQILDSGTVYTWQR
ncbi:FxsA family protein [Desulfoscipio gibsoniae]|uniref:Protein affecting phage T7 exclusion by the F plasmid n=1 Tax=Desulfoscipio gibsoniae DSM 7213 TaxID=767817 RepID=R4KDF1_9FIRM|nr:FxsA family protein [Desulfoscipio gibsoniae]AGL01218.1 protein affecting phage T7 exclusion by the F plasmid [Desulfoscipio gibsoniae DSM 7213]